MAGGVSVRLVKICYFWHIFTFREAGDYEERETKISFGEIIGLTSVLRTFCTESIRTKLHAFSLRFMHMQYGIKQNLAKLEKWCIYYIAIMASPSPIAPKPSLIDYTSNFRSSQVL